MFTCKNKFVNKHMTQAHILTYICAIFGVTECKITQIRM